MVLLESVNIIWLHNEKSLNIEREQGGSLRGSVSQTEILSFFQSRISHYDV